MRFYCGSFTCARLSEHVVVRSENSAVRPTAGGVHSAWLQINEDRTRNIISICHFNQLKSRKENNFILITGRLIVVDIDAVQLEITGSVILAHWVDAMLVRDDFPKLK